MSEAPQPGPGNYLRFEQSTAGFPPDAEGPILETYRRLMRIPGPLPRDMVPEKSIACALLRAGRAGYGLPDLLHVEAQALSDYRVPGTEDRVPAVFFTFHFVKRAGS